MILNSKIKLSKLYLTSVLILIGISSFLPSGFIFGFPLRHFVFLSSVFLLTVILFKSNFKISYSSKVRIYAVLTVILLMYLIYSIFQVTEMSYIFEDFKFIFITFLFFVFIELAKYLNNLSYKSLYEFAFLWAYYGVFLFCISKVILVFALLFNYIDYSYVTRIIFPAINYEPVGLSIELIGSRFSFVTLDFLSVVVFLFLLFDKNLSKIIPDKSKYLFYIFFLISLFSAYSRFLFAIIPIMVFIIYILNKEYKKIVFISLLVLCLIFINFELITSILQNRFLNQGHSDSHRIDMINNLTFFWNESVIFGHGYGSYVPWYIRSGEIPFSYEVQLLSILMRFGLFSLLFFFAIEIIIIWYILKFQSKRLIFVFLMFNLLLLASVTNQYLFNSTTNVTMLIMYLMAMSKIEVLKNANN